MSIPFKMIESGKLKDCIDGCRDGSQDNEKVIPAKGLRNMDAGVSSNHENENDEGKKSGVEN